MTDQTPQSRYRTSASPRLPVNRHSTPTATVACTPYHHSLHKPRVWRLCRCRFVRARVVAGLLQIEKTDAPIRQHRLQSASAWLRLRGSASSVTHSASLS